MYQDLLNNLKSELEKILNKLKEELGSIRTGRANPFLVENIQIECYGSKMILKQLAAIHVPEPRTLIINPWDKNLIKAIENQLSTRSDFSLTVDGETIRINLPPLTEEKRRDLVKLIKEKAEEARIAIRRHREEAWNKIQERFKEGKLREDDKFKGKDELQEVIDDYNERVEKMVKSKEEEIMKV